MKLSSFAARAAGIAILLSGSAFAQTGGQPGFGPGGGAGLGGTRPAAGGGPAMSLPTGGGGNLPATPSGSGTNVAVIDIAYIFKNHPGFKGQMEGMKTEIESYDAFIRGEQKKMQQERDSAVETLKANSPEFRKKEEDLTRRASDLQFQMANKRREFLEKEAAIYFKTYNELLSMVATFSEQNRIGIVLRFNGDEMDPQDRGSVLQGVNRAVVYQKNLDITQAILSDVVRRYPQGNAGVRPNPAQGGTATRPAPGPSSLNNPTRRN